MFTMQILKKGSANYHIWWGILFLILLVYATYAHIFFGNIDSYIALRGFSALDFSNFVLYPENFVRDYPGGARSTGNSLLSWIYPVLQKVGISPEITLVVMIALEMIVLSAGVVLLAQTIFKKSYPLAILVTVSLFILSWVRFSNLARFGYPFFHGQYYGFADGLGLIAIALYLRNRRLLSSLILITCFTIHPIKALFSFTFICGMSLWHWSSFFKRLPTFVPYLLFIIFAFLWGWLWLGLMDSENKMTHDEFFRYAPLINFHWFPHDLRIFDALHVKYMTPFLSAMIAFIAVIIRCDISREYKIKLILGMGTLALLTTFGLYASIAEISPTIVKSSPQRASLLMLSIATIAVSWQTITDIFSRNWWYAGLGAGLLSIAFFSREAWPLILTIIYAVSTLLNKENRLQSLWFTSLLLIMIIGVFCYEIALYLLGYQDMKDWLRQVDWSAYVILYTVIFAVFMFMVSFFTKIQQTILKLHIIPLLIIIFVGYGVYYWSVANRTLNIQKIKQGSALKSVQLWARNNTSTTSLFMPDPCHAYGWRDYSTRSSFGSMHEWYKTGWLYTGNQKNLREGIVRGKRLGIDVNKISYESPTRREMVTYFCSTSRRTFYNSDGEILSEITEDYNIQYVVMDKTQAKKYGGIPKWTRAFENSHYVVLVSPYHQN